jgi:hypothetical protein
MAIASTGSYRLLEQHQTNSRAAGSAVNPGRELPIINEIVIFPSIHSTDVRRRSPYKETNAIVPIRRGGHTKKRPVWRSARFIPPVRA